MKSNESAASGVIAGITIFIIVVVGALGFIYVSGAFDDQYNSAIKDPINITTTGMYLNNTTPYQGVTTITKGITDNIPFAILVAFLLAVILIVMLVWAMLKRGE
jgi:hypothetical protein